MPRIDEWEQKLLGNLAGSVQINPDERVLLVRSFYWHRQGPREDGNAYEARVADNWPNWVGDAREAKDRILHRAGINRQGNPIAAYQTSSLGVTGAGADPPQAPNDRRAATSLLSLPLAEVLLLPVAEANGDDRYGLVSTEELTVETKSFDDNIVDTVVVPNPKLPKRLCTNLGSMPTKPDVPAPPSLKIVIANATKKIPKKKSQADMVTELTKRRDDLLDCLQFDVEPSMSDLSNSFARTINAVYPYMEKQQKRILGLEEELAKLQSASSEQAILLGKKDLQMQTLRVKCLG
jgi:hypothetical protein